MNHQEIADLPGLRWGLVSQYRDQLFGISILLIMLFHGKTFDALAFSPVLSSYLPFQSWVSVGAIGVDVFLFLSGMGLYYAMRKQPPLRVFYKNRLKRILIPYLIIAGTYWFCRDVLMRGDGLQFWKDLSLVSYFTSGNATFWYIALILPLYFAAPLILRLFRGRFRTGMLFVLYGFCLALTLYFGVHHDELFSHLEIALNRTFIFILGCYFGTIIQEDRPMRSRWIVLALLILSGRGLVNYLSSFCPLPFLRKIIVRQWYNGVGFALCILLPILLRLLCSRQLNRFFAFLGTLSLELYLSHIASRNLVTAFFPDYKQWDFWPSCLTYLGVLLCACLVSVLLHQAQSKVELSLTNRKRSRTSL